MRSDLFHLCLPANVIQKDVNDRKREVKEKAAKLMKYYEHVCDPKFIISFDSQEFVD